LATLFKVVLREQNLPAFTLCGLEPTIIVLIMIKNNKEDKDKQPPFACSSRPRPYQPQHAAAQQSENNEGIAPNFFTHTPTPNATVTAFSSPGIMTVEQTAPTEMVVSSLSLNLDIPGLMHSLEYTRCPINVHLIQNTQISPPPTSVTENSPLNEQNLTIMPFQQQMFPPPQPPPHPLMPPPQPPPRIVPGIYSAEERQKKIDRLHLARLRRQRGEAPTPRINEEKQSRANKRKREQSGRFAKEKDK
jgi:hypothetical protein